MPPIYQNFNPVQMQGYIADRQANANVAAANAAARGQVGAARENSKASLYAQPGMFANAMSDLGSSYMSGLGSLGSGLGAGYGSMAQANAVAEAARQGAVGNIASSLLANYGSAANSAFGAWQANQTAYQKALADMYGSNQAAVSQLGQSRNAALSNFGSSRANALSGLADAYATAGVGLGAAGAVGDLDLNFSSTDGGYGGGGGIEANGGDIFSGSYGGGGYGPSSMNLTARRTGENNSVGEISGQVLGGLSSLAPSIGDMRPLDEIADNTYLDALREDGRAGMDRLDMQHYSSRNTPYQILSGLGPVMSQMANMGYGQSAMGMSQFYPQTQSLQQSLGAGIGRLAGSMGSGFSSARSGINNLFSQSLAKRPEFMTPAERYTQAQEVRDMRRAEQLENQRRGMIDSIYNNPNQQLYMDPLGGVRRGVGDGRQLSPLEAISALRNQDYSRRYG